MRTLVFGLVLLTGLSLHAQGTIDREVGEFHEIKAAMRLKFDR